MILIVETNISMKIIRAEIINVVILYHSMMGQYSSYIKSSTFRRAIDNT